MKRIRSIAGNVVWIALLVAGATLGAPGASAAGKRLRVSAMAQSEKCRECRKPEYPAQAKQARVQGLVSFYVVVNKEGAVSETKLITGHPLLAEAAQTAVKRWKYVPTQVAGQPVEIETEVSVRFTLN